MDRQSDPLPSSNLNSQSNANTNSLSRNGVQNDSVPISEDTVAAAGFNVQNPIMNALIGNIKGTLPVKKTPNANAVRCEVCNCEMSSDVVMSFHINGAKHKKKMKALEIVNQLKESGEKGLELGKEDDPNAFRCEICSLTVNSAQQLEIHVAGAKHRNKAAKAGLLVSDISSMASSSVPVNDIEQGGPPSKKKKKEEATLYCQICQITVNSQLQYDQHLVSKKHLNKLNPQKNPVAKIKNKAQNMRFVNFKSGGKQTFNTNIPNSFDEGNDRPNQPENFNNQGNFVKPGNFNNPGNSFEPSGNFNNPGNFQRPRNINNPSNPENFNDQEDFDVEENIQKPIKPLLAIGRFKNPGPQNYPGNFKNPRNDSNNPGRFKNPGHSQNSDFNPNNSSSNSFNNSRNFSGNNNSFNNNGSNKRSRQDFQNQNHDRMGPPRKNMKNNSGQYNNNNNNFKKNMQNSEIRGFQSRNALISPGNNHHNNRNFKGNNQGPLLSKGAMRPPPPPPPLLLS